MRKSSFLTARIDPKLKQEASQVLSQIGVSTGEAITMFLRQVVLRGGLPFSVRMPKSPTGVKGKELQARRRETFDNRTQNIINGAPQSSYEAKE